MRKLFRCLYVTNAEFSSLSRSHTLLQHDPNTPLPRATGAAPCQFIFADGRPPCSWTRRPALQPDRMFTILKFLTSVLGDTMKIRRRTNEYKRSMFTLSSAPEV